MKISVNENYRFIDSTTGDIIYAKFGNRECIRSVNIFDAFSLYPKFHDYVIEHCGLSYDVNHKIPFSSIPGEAESKISNLEKILVRTSLAIRELEIGEIEKIGEKEC